MNQGRPYPHTRSGSLFWRGILVEDGSELVETALVLPVFLLLLFGFINFAMILFGWCNMMYAAQAASRYISVHDPNGSYGTPDSQTMTAVTNIIKPFLFSYPANTNTVSATVGWASNTRSTYVPVAVVSISITYRITLPGYTLNAFKISTLAQDFVLTPQQPVPNAW